MDINVHSPWRKVRGGYNMLESQQRGSANELTLLFPCGFSEEQISSDPVQEYFKKKINRDLSKQRPGNVY